MPKDSAEDGVINLKLVPNENGMAITVQPDMSREQLAAVLHQAAGSAVLDDYILVSVFLALNEDGQSIVKTVSGIEVDEIFLSRALRKLADEFETGHFL